MSSPLDSSVTLGDALALVEARRIPIAPEVAGYLCLELAERASMQPGGLLPEGVFLGEEGSVAFVPRQGGEAPEQFVRTLLRRLLDASASRPAALWQVTTSTRPGVEGLVRELEAALIPLNRMASRRSLARLAREVKRVTHGVGRNAPSSVRKPSQPPAMSTPPRAHATAPAAGTLPPPTAPPVALPAPTPPPPRTSAPPPRLSAIDELLNALDPIAGPSAQMPDDATRRQLKEMAGLDPTPPPPTAQAHDDDTNDDDDDDELPSSADPTDEESEAVEALLAASVSGPQGRLAEAMRPSRPDLPRAEPRSARLPVADAVQAPAERAAEPSVKQAPVAARTADVPRELRRSTPPMPRLAEPRAGGGFRTIAVTLLLVFGAALALVWWLRPDLLPGTKKPQPAPSSSSAPERAPTRTCALRVAGAPDGAEILLLQGHAPLDVSPMPAGARIEFIGLLAGHAPKRAVIPAQAKWDADEHGRPRYELAFELAPSRKKNDNWPPAEPGTTVGGEGEPGTVHVVSSPRDSEVWLLIGSGPEAVLDPVGCRAQEILIASGTTLRTRLKVAAEDFLSGDGGTAWASVDAKRR